MTSALARALACIAGLALGASAFYACTLNPQPLPPGDKPEGGIAAGTAQDASTATVDDGGGTFGNGGAQPDSSAEAEAPVTAGAVDGGEGGSPLDAPADAPQDGPASGPDAQEDSG